jgi:hypothetical protein
MAAGRNGVRGNHGVSHGSALLNVSNLQIAAICPVLLNLERQLTVLAEAGRVSSELQILLAVRAQTSFRLNRPPVANRLGACVPWSSARWARKELRFPLI